MGPPSYMQSIVDRNVVMRRMPVQWYLGQRVTLLTNFLANEDFFAVFRTRLTNVLVDARDRLGCLRFYRNLREITFWLKKISTNECDPGTNYLL